MNDEARKTADLLGTIAAAALSTHAACGALTMLPMTEDRRQKALRDVQEDSKNILEAVGKHTDIFADNELEQVFTRSFKRYRSP